MIDGWFILCVQLSLPGKPLPSKLRVKVESLKGDADLFLSQSYATPTQSRYTWCNQEIGKSEIHMDMDSQDMKSYSVDKVGIQAPSGKLL